MEEKCYRYHIGILDTLFFLLAAIVSLKQASNFQKDDFDYFSFLTSALPLVLLFIYTAVKDLFSTITVDETGIQLKHKYFHWLSWKIDWKEVNHVWCRKNYVLTALVIEFNSNKEKEISVKRWRLRNEEMHDVAEKYALFEVINKHKKIEYQTFKEAYKYNNQKVHMQDIGEFAGKLCYALILVTLILIGTGFYVGSYSALGDGVPDLPGYALTGAIVLTFLFLLIKHKTQPAAIPLVLLLVAFAAGFASFQAMRIGVIWFGDESVQEYVLSEVDLSEPKQVWKSKYGNYSDLTLYISPEMSVYTEKGRVVELKLLTGWFGITLAPSDEIAKIVIKDKRFLAKE